MAGQITHIIAAEAALRRSVPGRAQRILEAAGAFFRFGAQGPDIFYHNQRTKPSGLHYGALAHRRGYGSIVEGAARSIVEGAARSIVDDSASGLGTEAEGLSVTAPGAYLLGLATHAALDRATHPFIVYFAGWQDPAIPGSDRFRSCHPFLERLLDVGLLSARLGLAPADFDIAVLLGLEPGDEAVIEDCFPGRGVEATLVGLWASGLRAAFPRSTGSDFLLERRARNALLDGRYFYRMTNPAITALNPEREDWFGYLDDRAGPRSVSLVYPESTPPELDVLNLGRARWEQPSGIGPDSNSSYLDLVDAGIEEAARVLALLVPILEEGTRALAKASIAAFVGNGGLSIVDEEGRSLAPRVCKPLPLLEMMEREYERRLEWVRRFYRGPPPH